MKNRISILFLALALMLMGTGCTELPDSTSSGSRTPPAYTDGGNFQDAHSSASLDSMSVQTPASSDNTAGTFTYKGFTTANIPEDIKNVYYGGGPNVLVTTENTLYLYDLSQDAIAAKAETIPSQRSYRAEHYKPIENGFVGLLQDLNRPDDGGGLQGAEGAPNVTCVFYDLQLNKTREINVLDALGEVISEDDQCFGIQQVKALDVSEDGSKIAVGSISSLYLYDIETGTGRQIISESENMIPGDVRFVENSCIAFGGAYLPAGAVESTYSYGTVDTDGSNLQILTPKEFCAGELSGANASLLLVSQDMRTTSGQLLLHPIGGEARTMKLANAKEGDMAYLSDEGAYFATSVNGEKLAIRIYELETGSLLSETFIAETDMSLISRVPDVRILDDMRTAIVIYGQHIDTQIKVIQF